MNAKKNLKILRIFILVMIVFALFMFLTKESAAVCQANYCAAEYSLGLMLGSFIIDLLLVLFAMLFWFVSPIGILFILGIKLFFSENASSIRKNFAILLQFLSFLSWSSAMFILLVVYIDSVFYGVLNLGGDILNLAIKSGFGFLIFMLILLSVEKKMFFLGQSRGDRKGDDRNNKNYCDNSFKEKADNSQKGRKKAESIKDKIKDKIKEEIKEAIDKKIDKL